ncbi:MAG: 5-oxoprolinase subunit PxpB [Pyrinomonadaceae bacterium]
MNFPPVRTFPLGDNALTIEFGNEISVPLNRAALRLADHFTTNPFPGFIEAVPAIASTTIFFRSSEVIQSCKVLTTASDFVRDLAVASIENLSFDDEPPGNFITVPVSFRESDALDLAAIAEHSGCTKDAVIEIFLANEYRVFMIGFLPGFPYLGVVDKKIAMPRLARPRASVPKGSVAIAGRQAGIYPSDSPGGWHIIGRVAIDLFDPVVPVPSYFSAGDRVRFTRA